MKKNRVIQFNSKEPILTKARSYVDIPVVRDVPSGGMEPGARGYPV